MKLKFLFFFMVIGSMLHAQDTIRSLVITEAFIGRQYRNHVEITNMGTEAINLSDFIFGQAQDDLFERNRKEIALPDKVLEPGESFLLTDFVEWMVDIPEEGWNVNERHMMGMPEAWAELADMKNHRSENNWGEPLSELDSVDDANFLGGWWGRNPVFIAHKVTDTSSVVIDQVGGVWDHPNGNGRQRPLSYEDSYSVAGYQNATSQARLIRKFSVKTGNKEFVRGVGEDDSEWFAIPFLFSANRAQPWTLKNHGDYNLDETTLDPVSDDIEVDFANKTITVPWGLRRPDDIMANMEKKPGVAWYYHLNSNSQDSMSFGVKSGDQLEVVVAGTDLDRGIFDVVVEEPTSSDNVVIPGIKWDAEGDYREAVKIDFVEWPVVTRNESGMDTIRGFKTQHYEKIPNPDVYHGLPYATRVDTLLKLLEKPANATWEIDWVDDVEKRADLKDGDILKVTAENGDVKEYYIMVEDYQPSDNVTLSAIQWPDIPDFYRGLFGWRGDTIPNFEPNANNYIVPIPFDVDGIPALTAKTEHNNATVEVTRATDLFGSVEDRTVSFKVTAEDDTTFRFYEVRLEKEKQAGNLEPYPAEPFFSKVMNNQQFSNAYLEICNPGNQPLDLSNYMVVQLWGNTDAAAAVSQNSGPDNWNNRYSKYVPGLKWVNEGEWAARPGTLTEDLAVNALVMPGDVFVLGKIGGDAVLNRIDPNYDWKVPGELDVQFLNTEGNLQNYNNPWGEEVGGVPLTYWSMSCLFLFKITNDSVKNGTKPASDVNDFQLIDTWGMPDGSNWRFSDPDTDNYGNANIASWVRKPEFTRPNPVFGASFGVVGDSVCEWIRHDDAYWRDDVKLPPPLFQAYAANELGSHFFIPPTAYMSTVGSSRYKVSKGYGPEEEIMGVVTGTTANEFLGYIIKYDEGQTLTLKSNADGSELGMDAQLSMNDTLIVISADSVNTTKYAIEVSESGLSSNAVLTSERYNIEILEEPKSAADNHMDGEGVITGMEYGTLLSTVLRNIEVPPGASLTVIDDEGAYVPLQTLNFDTTYVGVTVSTDIYFEVVAEDKVTKINYQLVPVAAEDDAFLTSNVYTINQKNRLIEHVPGGEYVEGGGINVSNFLDDLIPSKGATMKVVDKFGLERNDGQIYQDDKVVVTSPSGNVQTVYHISFLPNEIVWQGGIYLAYILSDHYSIDQVVNVVYRPDENVSVDDFLNRIHASEDATAVVVDMDGNVRTSGDLAANDRVQVISADGMQKVYYEINLATSTDVVDSGNIVLYPNPTNGRLNISGLKVGGRVQVFTATGTVIRDIKVNETIETVSLSDQPAGMYLILVSDANTLVGRYKVIRK